MTRPSARRIACNPAPATLSGSDATLDCVPPLIGVPGPEIVALARALMAHPETAPEAEDPILRQAAAIVQRELDDYDLGLIERTMQQTDERVQKALELSLSRRLVSAQLALKAQLATRAGGYDSPEPSEPS